MNIVRGSKCRGSLVAKHASKMFLGYFYFLSFLQEKDGWPILCLNFYADCMHFLFKNPITSTAHIVFSKCLLYIFRTSLAYYLQDINPFVLVCDFLFVSMSEPLDTHSVLCNFACNLLGKEYLDPVDYVRHHKTLLTMPVHRFHPPEHHKHTVNLNLRSYL